MVIRKLLLFNTILGFTIPKEYANALNLERGDYVQIFLGENHSLIVLKRQDKFMKITRKHQMISEEERKLYGNKE